MLVGAGMTMPSVAAVDSISAAACMSVMVCFGIGLLYQIVWLGVRSGFRGNFPSELVWRTVLLVF